MKKALEELRGMNVVVYDLEIKNSIGAMVGDKTVTWSTHDLMGISCGVLFDYRTGDFVVYLDDNMNDLAKRLNEADLVVAFNQINFDNRLLRASGLNLKPDEELKNYDMFVESIRSHHPDWSWEKGPRVKGFRLDDHLSAIFGNHFMKTDHGENAPKLYQRGEMGKLISYCVADVTREKALFEHMWTTGTAKTGLHGEKEVRHPSTLLT